MCPGSLWRKISCLLLSSGQACLSMVGDIVSPVAQHACRPSTSSGLEILVGFSADKTSGVMVHGSPHLAIAPAAFPRGRLVFSACLAEGYGFARADSVRGSGTAAPGRCRHCSVRDWLPAKTGSAPTLRQRGPCGCAASPGLVFSAPAHGIRSRVLLRYRERFLASEAFPSYSVQRKRRGEGWKGEMREKENNRQHSGRQPVATARVVQTGGWGQVRERPRAVPAPSPQVGRLIGAIVAVEFSLNRRRSALSSPRAVWRAISSRAENS